MTTHCSSRSFNVSSWWRSSSTTASSHAASCLKQRQSGSSSSWLLRRSATPPPAPTPSQRGIGTSKAIELTFHPIINTMASQESGITLPATMDTSTAWASPSRASATKKRSNHADGDRANTTPNKGGSKKQQKQQRHTSLKRRNRQPKQKAPNNDPSKSNQVQQQPQSPSPAAINGTNNASPKSSNLKPKRLTYSKKKQQKNQTNNTNSQPSNTPTAQTLTTSSTNVSTTKSTSNALVNNTQFHTWSRPDTFGKHIPKENYYEKDEMEKFEDEFMKETQLQFRVRTSATKKKLKHPIGTANNAHGALPLDLGRLSRYHWEDSMAVQYDESNNIHFRIFIAAQNCDERWRHKQFIYDKQRRMGVGAEKRIFNGREYYGLYAVLVPNELHRLIKSGEMQQHDMKDMYLDYSGGFTLRFQGVSTNSPSNNEDLTLQIKWRDMVDDAEDLLIFGAALNATRLFNRLFNDKANISYVHHIFVQMANETRGDSLAANALLAAYYQKRMIIAEEDSEIQQKEQLKAVCKDMTFLGKEKTEFFDRVDGAFEKELKGSMCEFQDFSQPIIIMLMLTTFVNEAKVLFPGIWLFLSSIRNIRSGEERGNKLIGSKELQVFFTLLMLARMADSRRLTHWALVSSFALYGWGVRNKAQDFTSFWGNTCSTDTRDRKMKELTENLLALQIKLLSSCKALVLVYDNYQRGQHLLFQRGGSSSNYLKGTHQLANAVHEWNDTTWDAKCVDMTYVDQAIASPSGLPAFEKIDRTAAAALSDLFTQYDSMVPEYEPDFTGERVEAYSDLAYTAVIINHIWRCFATENVCPATGVYNDAKIDHMHKLVRSEALAALFLGTKNFQDKATECWNPHVGEVTMTVMLGLLGLAEESSNECGAITLDQLYRMGILLEKEDGTWELAPDWEERRPILFGDAKTVENVSKFVRELASRPLSYNDMEHQADIFMDAMSNVMQLPGDWHAGMAMLQSIYTLFYRGFLEPFQKALD